MEKLSSRLWGIDWTRWLPRALGSKVVVRASDFDRALPFIERNYARIFEQHEQDDRFWESPHSTKARYYRECGDFFEFVLDQEQIGVLVCTPLDWSSYYVRSTGVLPEHQGKLLFSRFLPHLFAPLQQAGVERVEVDTSPSNTAAMHILTRARFNPTGVILSERWGAQVHFVRFLHDPCEDTFLRQFTTGVLYQRRERAIAAE